MSSEFQTRITAAPGARAYPLWSLVWSIVHPVRPSVSWALNTASETASARESNSNARVCRVWRNHQSFSFVKSFYCSWSYHRYTLTPRKMSSWLYLEKYYLEIMRFCYRSKICFLSSRSDAFIQEKISEIISLYGKVHQFPSKVRWFFSIQSEFCLSEEVIFLNEENCQLKL